MTKCVPNVAVWNRTTFQVADKNLAFHSCWGNFHTGSGCV